MESSNPTLPLLPDVDSVTQPDVNSVPLFMEDRYPSISDEDLSLDIDRPARMGLRPKAPPFLELNVDMPIRDKYDSYNSLFSLTWNNLPNGVNSFEDSITLVNLIRLEINRGKSLEHLPKTITSLRYLEYLVLKGCYSLLELPHDMSKLGSLKELCLWDCGISSLPNSITELHKLQVLELKRCFFLKQLPPNLNKLINLIKLSISDCGIECFPKEIITGLQKLQVLDLKHCNGLQDLLENLHELPSLTELTIWHSDINSLPSSITSRQHLEIIDLVNCVYLQELPQNLNMLVNLRQLCVQLCSISSLPSGLCNLQVLVVKDCSSLQELPDDVSDSLRHLHIVGTKISSIPPKIRRSPQFKDFKINLMAESVYHGTKRDLADMNRQFASENGQTDMENRQGSAATDQHYANFAYLSHSAIDSVGGENHAVNNGTHDKNPLGVHNKIYRSAKDISLEEFLRWQKSGISLDDACKHLRVAKSSFKRQMREDFKLHWKLDKEKEQNTRSAIGSEISQLNSVNHTNPAGHQDASKCLDGCPDEQLNRPCITNSINESGGTEHMDVDEQALEHLDGENNRTLSNVMQQNANSTTYVVKAEYRGEIATFEFSCTPSSRVAELKREVAKNLGIKVSKFKMRYHDDEKEWVLLTTDSHLKYALHLSKLSRRNKLRLSLIPDISI